MQDAQWSLQDAKNKLSAVIEAAKHGQPQVVTKRGVPTAVIVSVEEFTRLRRLENMNAPSFSEHLLSMPADDEEFERLEGFLRDTEL
jgi:antitoxin Phd